MALTKTARLNLAKQDQGDSLWHTGMNTGFDDADARLFQSGAGSPIGSVTPHYVGQRYHDTTNDVEWFANGATNNDWVRVGKIVVDTQANILALDADEYAHVWAYATDTGRKYLSFDPGGGFAWAQVDFSDDEDISSDYDEYTTIDPGLQIDETQWWDFTMAVAATTPATGNWEVEFKARWNASKGTGTSWNQFTVRLVVNDGAADTVVDEEVTLANGSFYQYAGKLGFTVDANSTPLVIANSKTYTARLEGRTKNGVQDMYLNSYDSRNLPTGSVPICWMQAKLRRGAS